MTSASTFGFWLVAGILFFIVASVLWQKIQSFKEDIQRHKQEKSLKSVKSGGVDESQR